jgi:hypothetical protein
MKREIVSLVFVFMLLVSAQLSSLPLVSADYTVDHASFPPDLPGDVNADAKVDMKDVSMVAKAFGSCFWRVHMEPYC